jgi:Family of unknown function (DUF6502)
MRGVSALHALLTELALVLLPRGMTPRQFGELARSAFVHVAADMSRLRNGKVNQSRVAAQTGLTRADVKRLLKRDAPGSFCPDQTPIRRVISGWLMDRKFANKDGRPKRLRIYGSRGTFSGLVKKYGGDVPRRALLDELLRIGAVTEAAGSVQLRPSLHRRLGNDFVFLGPVLPALIDGIRIASSKAGSSVSSSIHRLSLPVHSEIDLAVVRDRCSSSTKAMLDGIGHSLGAQVTSPKRKAAPAYTFTITVLLAENGVRSQGVRQLAGKAAKPFDV